MSKAISWSYKGISFCNVQFIYYILLSICLTISFNSHAYSLQDLIQNKRLTVTTKVIRQDIQTINQPIILSIEVATSRWFAKGTQIAQFEVANTVKLTNSETSINGTKQVKGETWSTQTREIILYPRRAGAYEVPAISVQVSINTEHNGIVEGYIATQPQYFEITIPDKLKNIENVIVSPQVTLDISTKNNSKDNNYSMGSAITRTVTITAEDAPAMMIPPIELIQLTGLSVYHQSPQVVDKSNRGALTGTRIETMTYTMEKAGIYSMPEQTIYWWDTKLNELKELKVPSITFNVEEGISNQESANNSMQINLKIIGYLCIFIIGLLSLTHIVSRYQSSLILLYVKLTHLEQRTIKKSFYQAIVDNQYISATHLLFQYALSLKINLDKVQTPEITRLNQLAFDNQIKDKDFTLESAKKIIKELNKYKKSPSESLNLTNSIKLNN